MTHGSITVMMAMVLKTMITHVLDKYSVPGIMLSSVPAQPHLLPSRALCQQRCCSHSGDEGIRAQRH